MKKISILMPTYNDSKYIKHSLDSIMEQKYENYEVLICNDGSTDDTEKVIKEYIKKHNKKDKIKYYYEDNADQLNAIIKLIPHIAGDYVYILHSDDLLYDENTLEKMVTYMENNKNISSIISDIVTIDKDDNVIGINKVTNYSTKNMDDIIALQLLWLGRNLFVDMAFHRREVFVKNIYHNYLVWNGPFWLNLDQMNIVNIKKVDFPFFKYRIGDNNYLNNNISKFNVINGEIRVVTRLLNNYYIPLYKLQYLIYRFLNKLSLSSKYKPFYIKKETKNKYNIIKFVLNKRFSDEEIKNNIYLDSLLTYYKNYKKRSISFSPKEDIIYYGKDMRVFNKKVVNNTIEKQYKELFNEMKKGFDEIVVNKSDYENMIDITKFLCIYPYAKVSVRKDVQDGKK